MKKRFWLLFLLAFWGRHAVGAHAELMLYEIEYEIPGESDGLGYIGDLSDPVWFGKVEIILIADTNDIYYDYYGPENHIIYKVVALDGLVEFDDIDYGFFPGGGLVFVRPFWETAGVRIGGQDEDLIGMAFQDTPLDTYDLSEPLETIYTNGIGGSWQDIQVGSVTATIPSFDEGTVSFFARSLETYGACCLPEGTCQNRDSRESCEGDNGTFHEYTLCMNTPAPCSRSSAVAPIINTLLLQVY